MSYKRDIRKKLVPKENWEGLLDYIMPIFSHIIHSHRHFFANLEFHQMLLLEEQSLIIKHFIF